MNKSKMTKLEEAKPFSREEKLQLVGIGFLIGVVFIGFLFVGTNSKICSSMKSSSAGATTTIPEENEPTIVIQPKMVCTQQEVGCTCPVGVSCMARCYRQICTELTTTRTLVENCDQDCLKFCSERKPINNVGEQLDSGCICHCVYSPTTIITTNVSTFNVGDTKTVYFGDMNCKNTSYTNVSATFKLTDDCGIQEVLYTNSETTTTTIMYYNGGSSGHLCNC